MYMDYEVILPDPNNEQECWPQETNQQHIN